MKIKSTTKRVIRCAAAVSALSAMVCFAGIAEASAATPQIEQVGATTSSISVKLNLDASKQNIQMGAVEFKQKAEDSWTAFPDEWVTEFTDKGATITNLLPAMNISQIKFHYTYSTATSSSRLSGSTIIYNAVTVAEKTKGLAIVKQLSNIKKLKFGFNAPDTLGGYQIQLRQSRVPKTTSTTLIHTPPTLSRKHRA